MVKINVSSLSMGGKLTKMLILFSSLVQPLSTLNCTTVAWQLLYLSIGTNNAIEYITIVVCKFLFATLNKPLLSKGG